MQRLEGLRSMLQVSSVVRWASALLREPLTHFAVIGAVLFGADHWLSSRRPDERVIHLGDAQRLAIADNFKHRQGREPSEAELMRLSERWLEDEVLYREGQALGLAQDDVTIKNRVVEKMRFLLSNAATTREPKEEDLREWLDEHRADYERSQGRDVEPVSARGEPEADLSPPDFAALRSELEADWKRDQKRRAALERLHALKNSYSIERDGT